jgi:hypothetical protein
LNEAAANNSMQRTSLRAAADAERRGQTETFMNISDFFAELGVEPDQRLRVAIEMSANDRGVSDSHLFLALYRLNTLSTRTLDLDLNRATYVGDGDNYDYTPLRKVSPNEAPLKGYLESVLRRARNESGDGKTLGTNLFLRTLLTRCLEAGDEFGSRPWLVDMLSKALGGRNDTPISELPKLQQLLRNLQAASSDADDFQYILALERERIVFRVVSVLDDFVQATPSGVLVPNRAILTHFRDQFGGFFGEEIEDLQDLLNNPKAREQELQEFFERNPHFFRKWDYREVHPQIYLERIDEGPLIPDFILTDRELQKAAIVDLKLPTPKLVRRQKNRDRFAACISEARTQLLRYRDWFRDKRNRDDLASRVGMKIYEPHLAVVIGRRGEFLDEVDRQLLSADNPDIEIVTYDDIVTFAERRKVVLNS